MRMKLLVVFLFIFVTIELSSCEQLNVNGGRNYDYFKDNENIDYPVGDKSLPTIRHISTRTTTKNYVLKAHIEETSKNLQKLKVSTSSSSKNKEPKLLEVTTTNGIVKGKMVIAKKYRSPLQYGGVKDSTTQKEVYAFLGIPFAAPPIGDLRFKRPVAHRKWKDVLEVTYLPNSCPQVVVENFQGFRGESQWNPNTNISEDCLYLNIWVPASIFMNRASPTSNLSSSMFWIHGGGFHSGSSTLDIYNGENLAAENNVIVVSSQYRLGVLGFLYFGTEESPGNLGLIDQTFALQWINDNIAAFGGNPGELTIFGESAGAASVSFHLLSPLSRSLFKRAILMSGVATASWSFRSKHEALEISYKLAKNVGCWSDETKQNQDVNQIIECLRGTDVNTIIGTQFIDLPKSIDQIPIFPTIDDYFLLDTPQNLIQNWDTKMADIIIGTVADEGTYFLLYTYMKYFNHLSKSYISYDIFVSILRDIFHDRPTYEMDAIIAQYTNWLNLEDGNENLNKLGDVIGDAFFTCPAKEFAQKWAGHGSNVWFYYFSHRSSTNPWGDWMGVLHADEIEYAFGVPLTIPDRQKNEMDLSLHFMKLLTNFGKVGNPSKNWKNYTPGHQVFLNINGSKISDYSMSNIYGPRAKECAFWNNYLPKLRKTITKEHNNINCEETGHNKYLKTCEKQKDPSTSISKTFLWKNPTTPHTPIILSE